MPLAEERPGSIELGRLARGEKDIAYGSDESMRRYSWSRPDWMEFDGLVRSQGNRSALPVVATSPCIPHKLE